jgi:AcrR family transcriptional regulator
LSVSTRDICKPLGVTQALLYRYFTSREALIDAALERVFAHLWVTDWHAHLEAAQGDLTARLIAFYTPYVTTATSTFMRLFMWCALSNYPVPQRFFVPLTNKILRAVVSAMRAEASLPGLSGKPMTQGERELAMTLHTSIVFISIRRHIYHMSLPEDLGSLVAMQVRAFVPGALVELKRLHKLPASDPMSVRVLDGSALRAKHQALPAQSRSGRESIVRAIGIGAARKGL